MRETADERMRQAELLWSEAGSFRLSRRGFLTLLASSSAAAVFTACETSAPTSFSSQAAGKPNRSTELIYLSATQLAQAIRKRKVSSEKVVNAYLQRIEAINPKINAIVQLVADTACAQARAADAALTRGEIKGPLHGVP
ncbi:MAG TPA: amidase family protein, partial [Candidatus Binatia bacterium]|nr:amidase family protein [Candidatus Binatia bacterium]